MQEGEKGLELRRRGQDSGGILGRQAGCTHLGSQPQGASLVGEPLALPAPPHATPADFGSTGP